MASLEARMDKLIDRISMLLDRLAEQRHDTIVHHHIDQYYYIEKFEELKLLNEALKNLRLEEDIISKCYAEVYCRWRKDVRWLNQYRVKKSS